MVVRRKANDSVLYTNLSLWLDERCSSLIFLYLFLVVSFGVNKMAQ